MDELLKQHWELILAIGSNLITFGVYKQKTDSHDKRIKQVESDQRELARDLTQVKVDVAEIKATTRAIYDQVRK